jgi:ketosteroid isomerase-like protein
MSEENVETFKRAVEAYNRRDIDALLEEMDPEVEWLAAVQTLFEGEARVYRGHAGIRQWVRDIDEALADIRLEFFEIRDLGDRLVASGRFSARGSASGAEAESPFGCLVDSKNGKTTRVQTFLDPKEALEAAGLRE